MQSKSFSLRFTQGFSHQFIWGMRSFTDPLFYIFLTLGLVAWFIPQPGDRLPIDWLLGKAGIEELFFRFILQEMLERLLQRRKLIGGLSQANALSSLAFSCMHLFRQPLLWAALTFFPSLLFGVAWSRYRSILSTTLIHFSYNMALFYRVF